MADSSSSAPDLGEKEKQEVPEEDSGVISKEPAPAPAPVPAPALENLSLTNEDSEDKDKGKDTVEPEKEKEDEKDTMTVQTTGSGWGAWGGMTGWNVMEKVNTVVNVAKKKSDEVYGLVSKDLGEVTHQASATVFSTATTLKKSLELGSFYCDPNRMYCGDPDILLIPEPLEESEFDDKTDVMADKAVDSLKKSATSFWSAASGYATQMFVQDDLESEALLIQDKGPVLLDRLQAQLYALASDPDTFTTDPHSDEKLKWEEWSTDLEKRQGEISDLMINNINVRQHYKELVPDKVSHKLFWNRYFFRVHLIELQEARRQALKKRAEQIRIESDSDINWDDIGDLAPTSPSTTDSGAKGGETDSPSTVAAPAEIPEHVQEQLLSDYEKELQTDKSLQKELGDAKTAVATTTTDADEKNSSGSDDWEKLSSGEKSPKKGAKEDDGWEEP